MEAQLRRRLTSTSNLATVGIAAAIAAIIIFILIGYGYEWTGNGEYVRIKANDQEDFQRRQKLWEWLQVLIGPIVLAIGEYLSNRGEREREAVRTDERAEADRKRAEQQRELEPQIGDDKEGE